MFATVIVACRGEPVRETETDEVATFLAGHWVRPVPLQGTPPQGPGWTALTVDLEPGSCAACHPAQHRDWVTSFHARAYSPGLEGQLIAWLDADPATVASCMACHGPLSEQLRALPAGDGWTLNSHFDPELERGGVVCAACHVRAWRRFGPPRRDGSRSPAPAGTPHQGATRTPAFEDSRFCAACHQFEQPAPNGKPLENTLREWEATPYAARGVSCQTCHMPDRRHLWRGIHDPEMVRSGATAEWIVRGKPRSHDFEIRLGLANTGTGHHLPTYVTPAIDLELAFLDTRGDTLATRRTTLRRDVVFDGAEWVERADDRIPYGQRREIAWQGPAPAGAARVLGRIRVRPDAFYERFFVELLEQTPADDPARPHLEEALARARESPFDLWSYEESLSR
ncbi:MAG: multiheme c-type cytochrome [Gemmatimonadota bacterium]